MKYIVYTLSTEYDMTQVMVLEELTKESGFSVLDYVNSSFHEHIEIHQDGDIEIENPADISLPEVLIQGD